MERRSILGLLRVRKIGNTAIRKKTNAIEALKLFRKLKWKCAGHVTRYLDKDGQRRSRNGAVDWDNEREVDP
ncbi:jg11357 [Pararge aegeria aegeria]|uniref:Jg11357 protein n=1 Tax=Pararge aegeria aegeria TaxID=348720 RepID=A0A8S4RNK0_9NEOP|nr:jg11357 [Pararge aegeria aegeria]